MTNEEMSAKVKLLEKQVDLLTRSLTLIGNTLIAMRLKSTNPQEFFDLADQCKAMSQEIENTEPITNPPQWMTRGPEAGETK